MKNVHRLHNRRIGVHVYTTAIGVAAVVMTLGLLYIWQQVQTHKLQREIIALEEQKSRMENENLKLSVLLRRVSSPDAMSADAASLLRLKSPEVGQVITLDNPNVLMADAETTDPARTDRKNAARRMPVAATPIMSTGGR